MKKLRNFFLGVFILLAVLLIGGYFYLNPNIKTPDNSIWTAFIGRDTTVGILPDTYANYYTYTLARTNKNVAFKIEGKFPDTRYMSFNVYDLKDVATQGSLIDKKIQSNSGQPNPYIVNKDSTDAGEAFTLYIVPERYENFDLPNKLVFNDDTRALLMVIRLYDFNKDDFGGVEYPTVQAITLDETEGEIVETVKRLPRNLDLRAYVRRFRLSTMQERLATYFETEQKAPLDATQNGKSYRTIPFHGIDKSGFIENNDNLYLLAGITKEEDEVYVFKIKSPTYTENASNINTSEVRYWSFNLGNAATYNFNGIKDEDCQVDEEGYANLVLAGKDAEIEARTKALGYDFLEWNMPWKKGLILFRHMLADPNFEAQIKDVPPVASGMKDFTAFEAYHFMGDYAPRGIRMSKADFLKEYTLEIVGE